eukprot:m.14974 g.14974  ORF g.14974 m.14974 type:complete len:201 (+) comp10388_c0_seq1:73-675(+)
MATTSITFEDAIALTPNTRLPELSMMLEANLAKSIALSPVPTGMKHGHWKKLQLAAQAAWDRHTVFALQQRMHDTSTFTQEETLSSARSEPAAPDATPSQLLLLGQTQVLLGSTQHMISIVMQFLNELAAPQRGSINMLRGMRTHVCADFLKEKDYEYVRQLELVASQLQFVDQLEIAPGHLRKIVIACRCALQQHAYSL